MHLWIPGDTRGKNQIFGFLRRLCIKYSLICSRRFLWKFFILYITKSSFSKFPNQIYVGSLQKNLSSKTIYGFLRNLSFVEKLPAVLQLL